VFQRLGAQGAVDRRQPQFAIAHRDMTCSRMSPERPIAARGEHGGRGRAGKRGISRDQMR
jgi:hypothetical protein